MLPKRSKPSRLRSLARRRFLWNGARVRAGPRAGGRDRGAREYQRRVRRRRSPALLAEAACRGAIYNVRINVSAMEEKAKGARLVEECGAC